MVVEILHRFVAFVALATVSTKMERLLGSTESVSLLCRRIGNAVDTMPGLVTNNTQNVASEMGEFRAKWQTLSIYEKFEQTIVGVLTLVIGFIVTAPTFQLILH